MRSIVRRLFIARRRQARLQLRNAVVGSRKPRLQRLDLFGLTGQNLREVIEHLLLLGDMDFKTVETVGSYCKAYTQQNKED